MLIGTRIYHGTTTAGQGDANDGSGPDFYFLNPENLENSDYQFPNLNFSAFAENIFDVNSKFRADQPPIYNDYRFRGNLADASIVGVETLGEFNLSSLLHLSTKSAWSAFGNLSVINARYRNSDDSSIEGKYVEMVPPFVLRTGVSYRKGGLSSSIQYSYVAKHYSDATNAERTSSAVEGVIPTYQVMDWSISYATKLLTFSGSCNNILNQRYFTRRADSYPGPGIVPSDGR